ncbi:MAG: glucose-6-phosphate dehydrogenase [Marinoscillum sp.]|uniref:glucose-6-phosphate dehydrogenase n=1 Tax=Marinoscillum sp. TaxID=2024838 RepID=UPI0032F536D4
MVNNDNQILVIFGASGDLTARKLIPAIYNLYKKKYLPEKYAIVGVGRSAYDNDTFRKKAVFENEHLKKKGDESLDEFAQLVHYHSMDTSDAEDYKKLADRLYSIDGYHGTNCNAIFYLSVPPSLYSVIPKHLASVGLNKETNGWTRVIIEKPFGYDLKSAQELNKSLLEDYHENQIYRIDHYLGKETVQNLLVTRFSNSIFEPLWNRNYIHRVEITSAESVGVEKRGGYYDGSGAMRDMVQNHLLQLIGLVAMEPPVKSDAHSIRNEKLKVFQSLRPMTKDDIRNDVVRGQYLASTIKGESVKGYREEEGVNPESRTETFVALKFFIDNWRWAGVPFYIRSGKKLPTRVSEVVIHFKPNHHHLFMNQTEVNAQNMLVIRIQPDEGILIKFGMKVPGAGFQVKNVNMDFQYADLTDAYVPDAYERLLLDCMQGDATLYARGDSVEAAWEFIDPILKAWQEDPAIPIYGYPAGTWGPENVDDLIEGKNMAWRYPCKNLADDGIFCEL